MAITARCSCGEEQVHKITAFNNIHRTGLNKSISLQQSRKNIKTYWNSVPEVYLEPMLDTSADEVSESLPLTIISGKISLL